MAKGTGSDAALSGQIRDVVSFDYGQAVSNMKRYVRERDRVLNSTSSGGAGSAAGKARQRAQQVASEEVKAAQAANRQIEADEKAHRQRLLTIQSVTNRAALQETRANLQAAKASALDQIGDLSLVTGGKSIVEGLFGLDEARIEAQRLGAIIASTDTAIQRLQQRGIAGGAEMDALVKKSAQAKGELNGIVASFSGLRGMVKGTGAALLQAVTTASLFTPAFAFASAALDAVLAKGSQIISDIVDPMKEARETTEAYGKSVLAAGGALKYLESNRITTGGGAQAIAEAAEANQRAIDALSASVDTITGGEGLASSATKAMEDAYNKVHDAILKKGGVEGGAMFSPNDIAYLKLQMSGLGDEAVRAMEETLKAEGAFADGSYASYAMVEKAVRAAIRARYEFARIPPPEPPKPQIWEAVAATQKDPGSRLDIEETAITNALERQRDLRNDALDALREGVDLTQEQRSALDGVNSQLLAQVAATGAYLRAAEATLEVARSRREEEQYTEELAELDKRIAELRAGPQLSATERLLAANERQTDELREQIDALAAQEQAIRASSDAWEKRFEASQAGQERRFDRALDYLAAQTEELEKQERAEARRRLIAEGTKKIAEAEAKERLAGIVQAGEDPGVAAARLLQARADTARVKAEVAESLREDPIERRRREIEVERARVEEAREHWQEEQDAIRALHEADVERALARVEAARAANEASLARYEAEAQRLQANIQTEEEAARRQIELAELVAQRQEIVDQHAYEQNTARLEQQVKNARTAFTAITGTMSEAITQQYTDALRRIELATPIAQATGKSLGEVMGDATFVTFANTVIERWNNELVPALAHAAGNVLTPPTVPGRDTGPYRARAMGGSVVVNRATDFGPLGVVGEAGRPEAVTVTPLPTLADQLPKMGRTGGGDTYVTVIVGQRVIDDAVVRVSRERAYHRFAGVRH